MAKKRKERKQKIRRKEQRQSVEPNAMAEDHKNHTLEIAGRYDDICNKIDYHVVAASELVSKLDPLRLQQRAYGEYAVLTLNKSVETELEEFDTVARRMMDYVQCLIVSTPPHPNGYIDLTDELWKELRQHIREIFSLLIVHFAAASAKRGIESNTDEEWERLFTRAQMNWCFVKGDRHINHLYSHLEALLHPHNDVFRELFGITATSFVDELEKIRVALTTGMFDAVWELKKLHENFFNQLSHDTDSDPQVDEDVGDFFNRKMEEYGYTAQLEKELGRFLGLDLFDLRKVTNLPVALLDNLSWSPGEEKDFFSQGPFKGWPLSLWPTWNRPFLKVGDNYYCFDMYSLSDNIYRAIQRIICSLKPEYKEIWQERQQAASEELPFQLFAKLLPGADFYRNVYYRWKTGQSKKLNWVECDGLVLYDDHLFIVEIKSGAFTYTPPATDAPAYIASIKSLLIKPAKQGQRFLNYLESSDKVTIYDKNHNPVTEISGKSFRQVTICCITLDQLTELAAKSSHLQIIDGGLPGTNIWNVSIDDLRVYTDILQNPFHFLHFVEQRHKASKSSLISLDDELDHLGLYLRHNYYVEHLEEFVASMDRHPDLIVWSGFSEEIDKYYSRSLPLGDVELPQQKLPSVINQILELLSVTKILGRAKAASLLLDMSGEARDNFAASTELALDRAKKNLRPQPLSFLGNVPITACCNLNVPGFDSEFDIIGHALANILIGNDQERLVLVLFFDRQDSLTNLELSFLTRQDIDKYGKEKIEALADELSAQRISRALAQGKIGRNDPCPCGSGKKYKQCHQRRNN